MAAYNIVAPGCGESTMLRIAIDKICEIAIKARAFDAKVEVVEPDYGSNPLDEDMREVLEDYSDDATFDELSQFIESLNEGEQIDLVALTWLGRDSFNADEWGDAVAEAYRAHSDFQSTTTAEYLLGIPLLADYLELGLEKLNLYSQTYALGD